MKMKRILMLFTMAVAIYSCGGNSSKSDTDAINQLKELELADVSIDSLIANSALYANQTVRFTAMVDHVCKHTGQKITVVGSQPGVKLKVMGSEEVPSFDDSLNGAKVEVVGLVKAVATEQIETCETDSTKQNITFAIECKSIRTL